MHSNSYSGLQSGSYYEKSFPKEDRLGREALKVPKERENSRSVGRSFSGTLVGHHGHSSSGMLRETGVLSNDADGAGTVERNNSGKMGSMEIEERKKRIDDGIFGYFLG
jgi:hypothetical protein